MRLSRRAVSSVAVAMGLTLVLSQTTLAASGDRDTTFGGDGIAEVNTTLGGEQATAVAVRDNKIVVVGRTSGAGGQDISVSRFDMSGNPDSTFGGGIGFVTMDVNGGYDEADGVAVLADDSIVIAGYSGNPGTGRYKMVLAKFKPNGDPDTTFGGGDGLVVTNFGKYGAIAYDLKVLGNGKIVAAGSIYSSASELSMAVFRFKPNGARDKTFSGDGLATFNMNAGDDEAWRLIVQADGKYLVAGWVQMSGVNTYNVGLARFNPNGSHDTTFGNNGRTLINATSNSNDYAQAVAIYNNKIYVLLNDEYELGLLRLKMNGKLDSTFDGDGKLFRNFTNLVQFADMTVDTSGRLVFAGSGSGSQLYVARLTTGFAVDSGFGAGGYQTAAAGGLAQAVTLQGDGKILAAGYSNNNTAVARFLP